MCIIHIIYCSFAAQDTLPDLAVDAQYSLANPSMHMVQEITQPKMFVGALKPYQLRGVNWLVNLYQQVGGLCDCFVLYCVEALLLYFAASCCPHRQGH